MGDSKKKKKDKHKTWEKAEEVDIDQSSATSEVVKKESK